MTADVDTNAVASLIREAAAAEALPRFKNLKAQDIDRSTPGDIVTVADHRMEQVLGDRLPALLPGSCVVGEEAVKANSEVLHLLEVDRPVWIVDPIDGTRNFAAGKADFAIIVALVRQGVTYAGWIYEPVADRMIFATKGGGTFLGDQHITRPSGPAEVGRLIGSIGPRRSAWLKEQRANGNQAVPAPRPRVGSAGREYMEFALGKMDFLAFAGPLRPWDHVAGVLIAEEAGAFAAMTPHGNAYLPSATRPAGDSLLSAANRGLWQDLAPFTLPL